MTLTDINALNHTPNGNNIEDENLSNRFRLSNMTSDSLAAWGAEHPGDLMYRVELAQRIALTFSDADQIIMFDDVAIQMLESNCADIAHLRGFDRSLLPALWLSTGFRFGGRIIVYAPPNIVELRAYLKLKSNIEQQLKRKLHIEILFEDVNDQVIDLIQVFENDTKQYVKLCEDFVQSPSKEFHAKYHINMLIHNLDIITKNVNRSFVFPYDMTNLHRLEFQPYADRLSWPDISNNDKAEHHFFLKSRGFTALPQMIAVSPDGLLINNYEEYKTTIKRIHQAQVKANPDSIEVIIVTNFFK